MTGEKLGENIVSFVFAIMAMAIVRNVAEYDSTILPNILPFIPDHLVQLRVYPVVVGLGTVAVFKWAFHNEA